MAEQRIINGVVYEKGDDGVIRLVGQPTSAAPAMPSAVAFPVNPVRAAKEAQDRARQDLADRRAEEDQRLQRERDARTAAQWNASHNPDGSPKESPSAGKPTEFQAKSAGFLGRMIEAEKKFGAVPETDRGPRSLTRQALHGMLPGIENKYVNSSGRQQADQAEENFIAASLRQESGAAISPQEFDRQYKIFFPAPGDSPETLAQKAEARRQAIDGFRIAAGPLAGPAEATTGERTTNATPAAPNVVRTEPQQPPIGNGPLEVNVVGGREPTPEEMAADPKLADAWGYHKSLLGQGLSGVNEGIAGVVGGPIDLMTGALNLGAKGVNAIANTDISGITKPILGSDWIKDRMGSHVIFDPTNDPTQKFVRRVGQSVGASVFPSMAAASKVRAASQLLGGLAGGIGGATAQQVAPGNPYAEMAGELAGGGLAAGGLMRGAQRSAQRGIEAAVPTIDELKAQAGNLYRQAEARGVVADPAATQELADHFRQALTAEGKISPTGRISEVYPKAKEAQQLIDDYAGQPMTPTQMQTVRKVTSEGLNSPDNTERRLGSILTDTFDEWANPRAPELADARNVASRYLTAEQLTQARQLAGVNASQFSGSGFENALRTQYRTLDRANVKGTKRFTDDVGAAIEKVNQGTPASNTARFLGKLAPRGVISLGLGTGAPAALGTMVGGPVGGAVLGGGALALGEVGRAAATRMGINAADQAELIARNGGNLITAPFATDDIVKMLQQAATAQSAKYLGKPVQK